ncbi:hypothetical protein L1I30_06915 [Gillisia sp. M10.2A]|uniref:Uncharacterized protein n=1 Tax=Gillisia lutea TaxID=2909668 RepID=A0ABS9EEU2_9FLAO|nr:hypothetical protein [Gillisia lutea]MCF4101390.1 hypothetical protein [Gillisia lutea]
METQVFFNSDLHFEHVQWQRELLFWEDELKSFKNKLEELATRWTDKSVLAQLEQFQNKFIRHGEVIDELQHEINVHETNMAEHSIKNEEVLDYSLLKNHINFRSKIETQRSIYQDLKKDLFRFLSKYM